MDHFGLFGRFVRDFRVVDSAADVVLVRTELVSSPSGWSDVGDAWYLQGNEAGGTSQS
jgi:hypothetical protein